MITGLIGRGLNHSYSPMLHEALGLMGYGLFSMEEGMLSSFLSDQRNEEGFFNVTMPHKLKACELCDQVSPEAMEAGAVNTIVLRDGKLLGYNTDIYGFKYMLKRDKVEVKGKHVAILGSGGAMRAVKVALLSMEVGQITVISRKGPVTVSDREKYADADILINATPVGMGRYIEMCPIDLDNFTNLSYVADLIYNPLASRLLLEAEKRGIKASNGLPMLVAQGLESERLGLDKELDERVIEKVIQEIFNKTAIISLVGMPGVGKTTLGGCLAKMLKKEFVDLDAYIALTTGKSPAEIIESEGEEAFREIETAALRSISERRGIVLATGGGVVTRPENKSILRQNGPVIFLDSDISNLATEGRPISAKKGLEMLYLERKPLYLDFASLVIEYGSSTEETAIEIIKALRL